MSAPTIDQKLCRESIYHKLNLLARFIDHMGSQEHYSEYEDDDFFAMYLFLSDIAKEVWPEWNQKAAAKEE